MSAHVFVEKTKHRDYLLVAAVVRPADQQLGAAVGQVAGVAGSTADSHEEGECGRKHLIADTIATSSVQAVIFDAGRDATSEPDAREACLHAVIAYAYGRGANRVVFEQDDSLLRWDPRLRGDHAVRRLSRLAAVCALPSCWGSCQTLSPGAGPKAVTGARTPQSLRASTRTRLR